MAFQINKNKDGKQASYFRLVRAYFNTDEKHLEVELRGYASKQDSDLAKTGARTEQFRYLFTLSGVDFPNVENAAWIKNTYKYIKTSPLYGGWGAALDV